MVSDKKLMEQVERLSPKIVDEIYRAGEKARVASFLRIRKMLDEMEEEDEGIKAEREIQRRKEKREKSILFKVIRAKDSLETRLIHRFGWDMVENLKVFLIVTATIVMAFSMGFTLIAILKRLLK